MAMTDEEKKKKQAEEAAKQAAATGTEAQKSTQSTFDQTTQGITDAAKLLSSLATISNTIFPQQQQQRQALMPRNTQSIPLFTPTGANFSPIPPPSLGGGGNQQLLALLAQMLQGQGR